MMFVELTDDDELILISDGKHKGRNAVAKKMSDGTHVMFILDKAPTRQTVYKVLDVFPVEQVELPSHLN